MQEKASHPFEATYIEPFFTMRNVVLQWWLRDVPACKNMLFLLECQIANKPRPDWFCHSPPDEAANLARGAASGPARVPARTLPLVRSLST